MPSPTIATRCPWRCSPAIAFTFSSGSSSANTSSTPTLRGDRPGGGRVVAGQHDDALHAAGPQPGDDLSAPGVPGRRCAAGRPARPSTPTYTVVFPSSPLQAAGVDTGLQQQRLVADQHRLAVHGRLHAAAAHRLECARAPARPRRPSRRTQPPPWPAGGRSAGRRRPRSGATSRSVQRRVHHLAPRHRRLAHRQRAGLVEHHRVDFRQGFEVHAALDQDAAAGGAGDGGDHHHRRGQARVRPGR